MNTHALKFSPSKDGRQRASVRVDFRVGLDALETAAMSLILKDMFQVIVSTDALDLKLDAEEIADTLNRVKVTDELRHLLQQYGYRLWDQESEYVDIAAEVAKERVAELWPALAAAERKAIETATEGSGGT